MNALAAYADDNSSSDSCGSEERDNTGPESVQAGRGDGDASAAVRDETGEESTSIVPDVVGGVAKTGLDTSGARHATNDAPHTVVSPTQRGDLDGPSSSRVRSTQEGGQSNEDGAGVSNLRNEAVSPNPRTAPDGSKSLLDTVKDEAVESSTGPEDKRPPDLSGQGHAKSEAGAKPNAVDGSAKLAANAPQPGKATKRRKKSKWKSRHHIEGSEGLPPEALRELEREGATSVSFVEIDAQASVAADTVTDADRAAAISASVFRERMRAAPVSRAQKRTHHITSLAASALAGVAAREAVVSAQRGANGGNDGKGRGKRK